MNSFGRLRWPSSLASRLLYSHFAPSASFAMHRAPQAMVSRPLATGLSINTPRDPNTLSNYNNFVTKHTIANLDIDFTRKALKGNVVLSLESITESETNEVVLDTRWVCT